MESTESFKTVLTGDSQTVKITSQGKTIEISSAMLDTLIDSLLLARAIAGEWGINQAPIAREYEYYRGGDDR